MPASTGVMQVRTFGCPFTTITQSVQRPMAQNTPRGLSSLVVWRCTITPAAFKAAAIGSPSYPFSGMPVEDVAWGKYCYDNAVKMGIGTKLHLWDAPTFA